MARLIGMSSAIKGKTYDLPEGTLTIGRRSDNDLPLESDTVSGHHCTLTHGEGVTILRDEGSTNGTRVNGRDITPEATLRHKDLVQVGSVEFLFEDPDAAPVDDDSGTPGAEVQIESGPVAAPDSFANVSPFAVKRRESTTVWSVCFSLAGLAAAAVLAFYLFKLFSLL